MKPMIRPTAIACVSTPSRYICDPWAAYIHPSSRPSSLHNVSDQPAAWRTQQLTLVKSRGAMLAARHRTHRHRHGDEFACFRAQKILEARGVWQKTDDGLRMVPPAKLFAARGLTGASRDYHGVSPITGMWRAESIPAYLLPLNIDRLVPCADTYVSVVASRSFCRAHITLASPVSAVQQWRSGQALDLLRSLEDQTEPSPPSTPSIEQPASGPCRHLLPTLGPHCCHFQLSPPPARP